MINQQDGGEYAIIQCLNDDPEKGDEITSEKLMDRLT